MVCEKRGDQCGACAACCVLCWAAHPVNSGGLQQSQSQRAPMRHSTCTCCALRHTSCTAASHTHVVLPHIVLAHCTACHRYDTLLVCDVGGGTYDVSLLEGFEGLLEVGGYGFFLFVFNASRHH